MHLQCMGDEEKQSILGRTTKEVVAQSIGSIISEREKITFTKGNQVIRTLKYHLMGLFAETVTKVRLSCKRYQCQGSTSF